MAARCVCFAHQSACGPAVPPLVQWMVVPPGSSRPTHACFPLCMSKSRLTLRLLGSSEPWPVCQPFEEYGGGLVRQAAASHVPVCAHSSSNSPLAAALCKWNRSTLPDGIPAVGGGSRGIQ